MGRQGGRIILGLITSIIIARSLGTEGRGIYAVVLVATMLPVALVNTGIVAAIIHFVARKELPLSEEVHKIIGLSLLISFLGMMLGIISLFFSSFLYPDISINLLILSITMIPVVILNQSYAAIFAGLEDFATNNLIQIASSIGIFLLTMLLVGFLSYGIWGSVISLLLGHLIALNVAIAVTNRHFKLKLLQPHFDWSYIKKVGSFGFKTQVGYIATILNYRADVYLLNWLTNTEFVGIYSQAVQLGEQLWIFSQAVSSTLLPRISALDGFEAQRSQITTIISRHMLWLNIALAILVYFTCEPLIVLIYGEDFRASASTLQILLPGLISVGTARVLANDISGRGRPELNGIHATLSAICNIIINIILIPRYGFWGAAIATSISYTILYFMKITTYLHLTQNKWHSLIFISSHDLKRWYTFGSLIKNKLYSTKPPQN